MKRAEDINKLREQHAKDATHRLDIKRAMEDAMVATRTHTRPETPPTPTRGTYALPVQRGKQETGWKDADPPHIDEKGMATIRSKVDAVLYGGASGPRGMKCDHKWRMIVGFSSCKTCGLLKGLWQSNLAVLVPLLKDKILPPVVDGGYREQCVVNDNLWIVKSLLGGGNRDMWIMFYLYVRFPRGWLYTGMFSEMRFDRIIRAVDPLLEAKRYNPVAVYSAVQTVLYGRCWENPATLARLL